MTTHDISNLRNILVDALSSEATVRNNAECQIENKKTNLPLFVQLLCKLLITNKERSVRLLAITLLRNILDIREKCKEAHAWKKLPLETKESLKCDILLIIQNENNNLDKIILIDLLVTIVENVFESISFEENWIELNSWINKSLMLPLEEINYSIIESTLYFLSQIFGYIYEDQIHFIDHYSQRFICFLKCENIGVRIRAVQASSEIICIINKQDSKKLKDLIPFLLDVTYRCIDQDKDKVIKINLVKLLP